MRLSQFNFQVVFQSLAEFIHRIVDFVVAQRSLAVTEHKFIRHALLVLLGKFFAGVDVKLT